MSFDFKEDVVFIGLSFNYMDKRFQSNGGTLFYVVGGTRG